ncbi:Phage replication protein [Lactobacillus amylovorus GRL 1112]|uniref:Phage replication protein n=1 Tax=Lactobacillus amylovorus (strain GRL 1112) TaxID=695560 RepID=E4SIT6_LACAR|nr:phage replication protein [Lactobacillus amylovorus]ADQ59085.1 Phage replication protein [Lactobacillus amylovorus GRL 1112]
MARLIKRDRGNYTNTSNKVIRDERLTWKARGIFNYLWSQADNWQFYVAEIANHAKDGVKSTRSGLDELEKYGYLKRINRHDKSGSFDGMDWILSDIGGLNSSKESEIDSENHRHDHFGDDAEKAQKVPKKCQKGSDAKQVGRKKGPTRNGTLRTINIKNYQYKEITSNKSSSSSQDEVKDPFSKQSDDDEKVISGLLKMFMKEANIVIPDYQYPVIMRSLLNLGQSNAIDLMYTVIDKVSTDVVQNPIGYLKVSINNASVPKGGEINGNG